MPTINMKVIEKDGGSWEVNAKGLFFCSLHLHSHPKSQIKKITKIGKTLKNMVIKEYDYYYGDLKK